MMSIHGFIDNVALGLGAAFMPKYFREGYDSPGAAEHIQGVNLHLPEIGGEGTYDITADTLDLYTPLLAGTVMNEAYLRSAYSRAVDPAAKANPEVIDSVLNFESDFADLDNGNVFPLLATSDQIINYERQKASYGGCPVVSFNKGHTTGALSYRVLREHVMKHVEQ